VKAKYEGREEDNSAKLLIFFFALYCKESQIDLISIIIEKCKRFNPSNKGKTITSSPWFAIPSEIQSLAQL
jgi:hypothetical protein